jgi:selenocysteine-specific elongation factor
MTRNFIVATAGHVDHGKSALVKALTGTDPDRLPEEKARKMTIELGFAHLELSAPPSTGNQLFSVSIVDVPGHEDFVRNMIAGVGSIDLALIVVAADDGWMPQSEEHLQILTYLGVSNGVVALTKSDLGGATETATQICEQLRDTPFDGSPIVPLSVRNAEGLEKLKEAIAFRLARMEPQRDIGKPRLFVDRAFTLRGIGTVVTGTLTGGTLHHGQVIALQPHNRSSRIRSIQSHNHDIGLARPGMRTALNIPDVEVGVSANGIERGHVVALPGFEPSRTLDVLLERLPSRSETDRLGRQLKSGMSLYLHHGTGRCRAKAILRDADILEFGQSAIAQLRLDSPVLAFLGDRFVIRDSSEQFTIAGGVVLDPEGDRLSQRTAARTAWLRKRAAAIDDIDACVESEIARDGPTLASMLLRKSHFAAPDIAMALRRLQDGDRIVLHGEVAATKEAWDGLRHAAAGLIDRAHEQHPERKGLELAQLRARLALRESEMFEMLLSDLCSGDFVRRSATIARRYHQPVLPPAMQRTATRLHEIISAAPFDPPPRKELEQNGETRQVLRFLIEQGKLLEVGDDLIFVPEILERMKSNILEFIRRHGPATVSEIRQELKTSRRIMVPLLEQLDRDGVTRRVGDQRILAKRSSD